MQIETAETLFIEATQLLHQNLFVDAIRKYLELADTFPESDLADDALFNTGLCYFDIGLYNNATTIFKDVIAKYPDGDINTSQGNEFGKTAAKCHYVLINCYLGMGNIEAAQSEMNYLKNYHDSYILTALGEKITFVELGEKAIASFLNK